MPNIKTVGVVLMCISLFEPIKGMRNRFAFVILSSSCPKKENATRKKILCKTIEVELRNRKTTCRIWLAYNPAYITFIENDTNCMLAPIDHARVLVVRKIIDQLF